MGDDPLELAAALRRRGEPFALATVVRCEPPTSAKPGAKALIRPDGAISGWVGGACAEPVVVREALGALRDGRPRLVGLVGEGEPSARRIVGMQTYPMACHSGGTLEIYVEPYLAKPLLVLVGQGPVVEALAALAELAEYAVQVVGAGDAEALGRIPLTGAASVVVATHADSDEDALDRTLRSDAGYVGLVASRRRATAILERLAKRGVPADARGRLRAPAGLDIGAHTPPEIAVSILAELVRERRRAASPPGDAVASPAAGAGAPADPICGMPVDVATARYRSQAWGQTVYFCCRPCQEAFDRDPERYRAAVDA